MVTRAGHLAAASAAIVLAALAVSADTRNTLEYQLNITDMSPIIEFTRVQGDAWQPKFDTSISPGDPVVGESVHTVTPGDFNVTLGFKGQAKSITVLGDKAGAAAPDNAITWSLVGVNDLLTSEVAPDTEGGYKLQPGQLTGIVNVPSDKISRAVFEIHDPVPGEYNVRGAEIVATFQSEAKTVDQVPVTDVPFVVDGALNPVFQQYDGERMGSTKQPQWNVTTSTVYIDGVKQEVQEVIGFNTSALSVSVPDNTAFVLINGTTGPGRGGGRVTWSPSLPGVSASYSDASATWNATSPYVAATTLYYQAIDPDVRYQLSVMGVSFNKANTAVGVHSIKFFSGNLAKSPMSKGGGSKGSSTGLIVGVVVGVGGGLILAVAAFYFCFWRPRRKRERREEEERDAVNAGFVPFGAGHQSIVQEEDAGTAIAPPSYDPQWSGQGVDADAQMTEHHGGPTLSPVAYSGLNEKGPKSPTADSPKTPVADWKVPTLAGAYSGSARGDDGPLSAAPLSAYPRNSPVSPIADYKAPLLDPRYMNQASLPPGADGPHSPPPLSPAPLRNGSGDASTDRLLLDAPDTGSRPLPSPPGAPHDNAL